MVVGVSLLQGGRGGRRGGGEGGGGEGGGGRRGGERRGEGGGGEGKPSLVLKGSTRHLAKDTTQQIQLSCRYREHFSHVLLKFVLMP